MFWWIIGFASGIAAFGGWRMFVQKRHAFFGWQPFLGADKGEDLTEAPETMESLLLKRMDRRLTSMEEKLDSLMAVMSGGNAAAVGASMATGSKERDKPVADQYQTQLDQIVKLAERGTVLEDIAKKMKMHKGEVQLLLNLSKKSS